MKNASEISQNKDVAFVRQRSQKKINTKSYKICYACPKQGEFRILKSTFSLNSS